MKTQYYKLSITSVGYDEETNAYPEGGAIVNSLEENFHTMNEVKDYIKDNYPEDATWNGAYVDDKEGNAIQIGWVVGFYNNDIPHDSAPWWQEDWISIYKMEKEMTIPTGWEMEP